MILQTPDRSHLEAWFASKLPTVSDLSITEMKRSFPGMSRETWFLRVQWQEHGRSVQKRYVLRTQLPGGVSLSPQPLAYEARVFEILGHTNVPVPTLLWFEEDPRWMIDGTRPFFVREMSPGVVEPPNIRDPDSRFDEQRIAMVKELLEKLARVHCLDWRALGFDQFMPVPPSAGDCAQFEIDSLQSYFDEQRLEPFPATTAAMLRLKERAPPPPQRIVLRKENNGLGEEIWSEDGTRIVAMSDWETASLGDPALDIAIALRTTGWAWNLQGMLEHYERCSGIHIEPASVHFYGVMWAMKMVVNLHAGLRFFLSDRDRRIQIVSLGVYTHVAENQLATAAGF
jgi:aminoglycoside phosphotransferase (APT) family kinase protein